MTEEEAAAAYPHVDGPAGMHLLPDGSLVVPERYVARYGRADGTVSTKTEDRRTPTERDRGRVSYSSYLRRLAGVTQVVSPDLSASRMHSRESHTHKVALVAREIAETLARKAVDGDETAAELIAKAGGLDITACEAAGLAHDLGHAPFGHAGERELDRLVRAAKVSDGFEGNAQTFRIVTHLDSGRIDREGMDLTNVTLAAILKYPWARPEEEGLPKFGAYKIEHDILIRARLKVLGEGGDTSRQQTLEASIMDLADDIAYAVHDLEDFITAGMIDLTNVVRTLQVATRATDDSITIEESASDDPFTQATKGSKGLRERYKGLYSDAEYLAAITRVEHFMRSEILDRDYGEPAAVTAAAVKGILSDRISRYFRSVSLTAEPQYDDGPLMHLDPSQWHEIQVLKTITKHHLISSPRMGLIQQAQKQTIRSLFDGVAEWLLEAREQRELPQGLQATLAAIGHPELPVDKAKRENGALEEGQETKEPELAAEHYRAIADFICGMSDSEALLRSAWITGREVPGMATVVEAL